LDSLGQQHPEKNIKTNKPKSLITIEVDSQGVGNIKGHYFNNKKAKSDEKL